MASPWMKFYPADWRADPVLRLCSMAARGLWVEMLCIMHEAVPYGSLLVNGRRLDKKQLASLVGMSEKECTMLLIELEGGGVFSRDDDGTIYSRRMRRDAEKSERDKANGRLGGNPQVKGGVNPKVKAQIPEARSQSQKEETRVTALAPDGFDTFWFDWPNKVGKPAAMKAYRAAINRGSSLEEILVGIGNYVRSKPPDRPWLNPATFLNQDRWKDQPAAVGAQNGQTGNISAACDNLIERVKRGFGGAPPEDSFGGRADETDARLLPYRSS